MTTNMHELLSMPTEFLMERLESLLKVMVIVEMGALIFIIITFATLSWLVSRKAERTRQESEGSLNSAALGRPSRDTIY
jgi:hypothetical protein